MPFNRTSRANPNAVDVFVDGFLRRYPDAKRFMIEVKDSNSKRGGEASLELGRIQIRKKFWALDREIQDAVMWHELGHAWQPDDIIERASAQGLDLWNLEELCYGQPNMDEAFAEAFMAYHLAPEELWSRFPAWYELVDGILKEHEIVDHG